MAYNPSLWNSAPSSLYPPHPDSRASQAIQQPPEKLSLFAQTMLQADEEFYATFPQARPPGPWQVGHISGGHFEGTCFYYNPEEPVVDYEAPASSSSSSSPTTNYTPFNNQHLDNIYEPTLTTPIDSRMISHGLHYDYSAQPTLSLHTHYPMVVDAVTDREYSHYGSQGYMPINHHRGASYDEAAPSPQTMHSPSETLMVEQHLPHHSPQNSPEQSYQHEPHMNSLIPPESQNRPLPNATPVACLSPVDPSPSPSTSLHEASIPSPVHLDDQREQFIKSESPDQTVSARRTRHLRRDQRDESRSLSHGRNVPFRGWSSHRSPSPHQTMRLSPLPSRRPPEKKPSLACLFCRGRKIACGPPLPGSNTCNQCQRRSLVCEYPTESRRGMRKKKHSMEVTSPTTVEGKAVA